MKRWVPMVVLFAAAALIDASCDCSGSARVNQPDGGPTDGGGPGSICLATNNSCSVNSGGVCCSGVCSNGSCAPATYRRRNDMHQQLRLLYGDLQHFPQLCSHSWFAGYLQRAGAGVQLARSLLLHQLPRRSLRAGLQLPG